MPNLIAVPNYNNMYIAPMRYACCWWCTTSYSNWLFLYGPLGRHDYKLCRHYCARAVVFVATPLHIEQGGLRSSVCVYVCTRMHLHACVNACPLNLRPMCTKHSVSPEPSHTLNLLCLLSILFQVSFLHLLSLVTGHSVSCKPSPSTNIPLFTKHSFCYEPSVSTQPNLSNENSVPWQTFALLSH